MGGEMLAEAIPERVHAGPPSVRKNCVVPESKTTSPWLDSKEHTAYDASTLDGSEVRAGYRGIDDPLRVCAWLRTGHQSRKPDDLVAMKLL